ncbi:SMI1/KNR4 family protein [Streptomyces sp. M-16]|uniref:SMI1/KNR4 family protein n=1 Tax=Streptomyces sp. M-16 TaxID=3233040 RepID=UPI003F94DC43
MTDSFDVARSLTDGLPDRERAWAFIRDFAASWGGSSAEGHGTPMAELAAVEAELGFSLPAALREFYALVGGRSDLVDNQDPLLPPAELFVHDGGGGVLVFRSENQGCAFWGVRLRDLDQDDPPVFVESRHGWVPFMDRVSLACVELVLSEALFGGGGRLYNACELPADLLGAVRERFRRVELPEYPMWTGPEDSPALWFSAPGKLLRQDGVGTHSWLHVRGRTRSDLEAIYEAVPGQWALGYETSGTDSLPF